MFYTRIILNSRHPALKNDRKNGYERHRRIESLFPDCKRSEANALFRWAQPTIFVQSEIEPQFSLLPKHYTLDIATKTIDISNRLQINQWLEFKLLADTSTRLKKGRNLEELPKWLADRLEGVAELDEYLDIQREPHIQIQRLQQEWVLKPISFSGCLKVLAPSQFAARVMAGFGRSRAYGCGLMQIAPAKGVAA